MSVGQKAGKAAILLFGRRIWGVIVNVAVMAILARELDKADFGILAISQTFIGFIALLGISGIGEYVIFYQGENKKELYSAAFWLNTILTLLVAGVIFISAPYWAKFYGDSRITNMVHLLLISFIANMASTIPTALFRKELNYQPIILLETIFNALTNIAKVGFALYGFGVYSLALPVAIFSPLLTLAYFIRTGFQPQFYLGINYWKQIFTYTKYIIGARLLGKLVNEGDNLIVGKLLSLEALGIYSLAFQLANLINGYLVPIITNISMPVLARNANDLPLIRERFLKMIFLIAFITTPLFAALILLAEPIVLLWYGDKWLDAVIPLQILSIFALFRSLSSPTSGLYNATGKPQIGFYFSLVFAPIFFGVVYFSHFYGLVALCWGVTLIRVIGGQFLIYISLATIKTNMRSFYDVIKAPAISGLIAFGISFVTFSLNQKEFIFNKAPLYFLCIFLYSFFFIVVMKMLFSKQLNIFFNTLSSHNKTFATLLAKLNLNTK